MKCQKRIKGIKRERLNSNVLREIQDKVSYVAIMNDVSKSFVIAVALAEYFGITKQEKFNESKPTKTRIVRKTPRNRLSSTNVARTH